MLVVPESLNRNAKSVSEMASPEETGRLLINYMCERIGIESLASLDVLDFGCGVRFSQSIINLKLPIGRYFGLDVNQKIIDFLNENVTDNRLSYMKVNIRNQMYNKRGEQLDNNDLSFLGNASFDIACMFSVITHQNPDEATPIFRLLANHIRPNGHMFFSSFIHDDDDVDYKELKPEKPGLMSSYSLPFMETILADCGWNITSYADPTPDNLPIMSSFLCSPH